MGKGRTEVVLRSLQAGHDQKTYKTYLRPNDGKCLHDYVYLIDNHMGLCYVGVPTWCPFRLQVYCNGHRYLARQLSQSKIEYRILDNAFGWIADFDQAQKLADEFPAEMRYRHLDDFAAGSCPVLKLFELSYHGSLDQEFGTDVTRTAIHTVKPAA